MCARICEITVDYMVQFYRVIVIDYIINFLPRNFEDNFMHYIDLCFTGHSKQFDSE